MFKFITNKMPPKSNKSPSAWDKPKDIMKRHLIKRKSSRQLNLVSESSRSNLESVKEHTNDDSKFSMIEDSQSRFSESNPFKNLTNSPGKFKRKRSSFFEIASSESSTLSNLNDQSFKKNKAVASFCESEISAIDWDDTTARFSFECSLPRNNSTTNLNNGSFEDKLSQTINNVYPIDFSHFSSLCSSTPKTETNSFKKNATDVPLDLRIGSKLRIISRKPFTWMKNSTSVGNYPIKFSSDEITHAMKYSMNGYAENNELNIMDGFVSKTPIALAQASSFYYESSNPTSKSIFPRLEGLVLNPRTPKNSNNFSTIDWVESFDHLFSTWINNQRKLFYVCTYSFTILFTRSLKHNLKSDESNFNSRKSKSNTLKDNIISPISSTSYNNKSGSCKNAENIENATHKVVVTPTTLGLREMLNAQGIKFTLPLRFNKILIDFAEDDCDKDFLQPAEKKEEDFDLDEDEWLKEIGISPKSTLKLKKTFSSIDFSKEILEGDDIERSNDQQLSSDRLNDISDSSQNKRKGAESSIDEARRSTILITEDKSIEAFVKILRSLKIGVSKTGFHSGIPPTLLASSPFYGGNLKKLKMSSQITKKNGELRYIFEFSNGPILPFVSKMLVEFLNLSELSNSSIKDNESNLINKVSNIAQIQVLGRLAYNGMNEAVDDKLAANLNEFEIDFSSGTFSW